ncbi:MAG: TPM domain-containing protein [Rhodoferax sp.]
MFQRIARLFKHRWMDDSHRVIAPAAVQRLMQSVAASEARHSGEIRICIEAGLPNSYLLRPDSMADLTRQRALAQFGKLRVWDTAHNNGVLIYLLLAERTIEVVADRGLNPHISPAQWQAIVQRLGEALRAGRFEDGLGQALGEVSVLLATHFPPQAGAAHANELPDEPALL